MSFNTDLTRKDIEFLDMLRDTIHYPEDYIYYSQMVEELIGSLDTDEDWRLYFKRINELYGRDEQ